MYISCSWRINIILYFGDNLSNSINRFCTPSSIRYFDMKHVAWIGIYSYSKMRVYMFMSETIELSITPWLPETAHVICQFWDLIMQAYVGVWCYHLVMKCRNCQLVKYTCMCMWWILISLHKMARKNVSASPQQMSTRIKVQQHNN